MNKVNELKLICKNCGSERFFSNKYVMKKAEDKRFCNKCSHGLVFMKVKHLVNKEKSKNCPVCGRVQVYKENETYYRALLNNVKCNSCREFTETHKGNISKSNVGRIQSQKTILKRQNTIKDRYPSGVKKSKESIQKTVEGLKQWRILNPDKEKLRTLNARKTLLERYGNYFSHTHKPCYNKSACIIFNRINEELGWSGIHAETNDEGEYKIKINDHTLYYVDYYEPTHNVVIEFDEQYHFKPSTNGELEKIRQTNIIKFLNCKFYRIKYNDDIDKFILFLKNENKC
jgi:hypothetical protein